MKSLMCILILPLLHSFSLSVAVDIPVDNTTSQLCVGRSVTLTCNIDGIFTFAWTVPGSLNRSDGVITNIGGTSTFNEFTLTFVDGSSTSSTLSFNAFVGLNNTDITCEGIDNGATQSTLIQHVQILGMTCPSISAIGYSNFTGVTVALMNRPMCVQEYSVNVTGGDEVRSVTISNDEVVIPLALCNFAYEIVVIAMFIEGFEICPSVEVSFPVEGIGDLNVTANGNVVSWFVTSDTLMDCISGYRLIDRTNKIMDVPKTQNTFNLSSYNDDRCTIGSVTVTALIVDRETGFFNTVTLCNMTRVVLETITTKETMTTPRIEHESESQNQNYVGALIGVIIGALVIIIVLTLVIILLAVKLKLLKSKIVVSNSENGETQYDEVIDSKSNKQNFNKNTYNLTQGDAGIAMVGCEAYGKVSVQPQVQSAGQHGEGAAGVYETV